MQKSQMQTRLSDVGHWMSLVSIVYLFVYLCFPTAVSILNIAIKLWGLNNEVIFLHKPNKVRFNFIAFCIYSKPPQIFSSFFNGITSNLNYVTLYLYL